MPRYTVAICHLNMVETVEESVRSIHRHTNEEFEILVIDDGSTDGSRDLLGRLAKQLERLRVVDADNQNIAQARNCSIEEARGEYVLHQLDADDRYDEGIVDFTRVFEALTDAVDKEVYLRGKNIHLASRALLQRIPYRDVGYGEDLDLWRRMDAEPTVEMIWLRHTPINEQIGYRRDLLEYAEVRYSTAKVNFQTGIAPLSYLRWMGKELWPGGWQTRPWYGSLFHVAITPVAYIHSLFEGHLDNSQIPDAHRQFDWYMDHILRETVTLRELIKTYELDLSSEDLSPAGKRMFLEQPLPSTEKTVP